MTQKEIIYTIKNALLIWTGVCLVFVGLVSLLIPISPGLILIILGLSLISKGLEEKNDQSIFIRFRKIMHKYLPKKLKYLKILNIGLTNKK